MNTRLARRLELDLTQSLAATNAGLSLATWRRWEEDPDAVSSKTREACENVLAKDSETSRALAKSAAQFEKSWRNCPYLTPRQAFAIALTLDLWADTDIREWLGAPADEPLHEVSPFARFDRRVMFYVGENRAWAEKVRERCYAISDEIENGVLPFNRDGAYIDELLIAAALTEAKDFLSDMPEIFERISPRSASETDDDDDTTNDDNWDVVSDSFDDMCRWDDWEVPLYTNHPLLPAVLADRHPFTWFDVVPSTGAGYLQRLQGLLITHDEGNE
ncbi:hypothetical protein [Arthrobacter sp. CG_A4]|uniref:hypothetical protein n=1 Tax=Arthrobacter sp. CG_A4 TaxID=3071706 RepID=UPI002E009C66|nr:hypothetical protein [Arthrobacter sp. CG_A4]